MWSGNLSKTELATFKQQVAACQVLSHDVPPQLQLGIKATLTNVPTVVERNQDQGIVLKIVGNGDLCGQKVWAHRRSFMFNNGVPWDFRFVLQIVFRFHAFMVAVRKKLFSFQNCVA